jgi:hypothetical protein
MPFPIFAILLVLALTHAVAQTLPGNVDFLKEVQPVLTAKCLSCHTGDGAQAGLKAHTREDLLRGGKSGPAIVPGQGSDSLLVLRMQGKKGLRMPPAGPPVEAATLERIRLWIDQGAKFDGPAISDRIAPLAPRTPEIPSGDEANPVDRFIDAYFAKHGIKSPSLVSDALFARRAWLDITGLPPTPEELREFERSKLPDKRARIVDTLLGRRKPYAEHWISFWNDLLRNDEGVIYHGERKSITEWLLDALEQNMPYDAMVSSLLDPPLKSGAEGFLTGMTWRGVISASQTPPMQAAQNAAQVFLGINLKCAGCHDSFINRWKLSDTYGLASMFSEEPLELVRCDVRLGKMAEPKFPFPDLKVAFDDTLASRRKAASEWFVHRENGRFARTLVNRYWRQLLGRGIVEPADDMDAQPWDQDLLDWLAADFASNGYDLQKLMRRIMTSRAYQMEAAEREGEQPRERNSTDPFRGPELRRISAEQFQDAISAVTGEWRVSSKRTDTHSTYSREWRLKSDPLSRALGRPIRDQVYTERSTIATTLQALEMTNGPLLSHRLERGAKALLGELPPTPANLFDSKVVRSGAVPVDIDISSAQELWLLIEDVDSYDPARVIAGWANAEVTGPDGGVKLETLAARQSANAQELKLARSTASALTGKLPLTLVWDIREKGFTRFKAEAAVDERSRQSDINPAVRFFVFTERPDPDHLIRVQGDAPSEPPRKKWTADDLAERLYRHLLARAPTTAERRTAQEMLGGSRVSAAGVEDLLWALLMSPEFQYIH